MKRTLAKRNLLTALLFAVILASAVFAAVFATRPLTAAAAAGCGAEISLADIKADGTYDKILAKYLK